MEDSFFKWVRRLLSLWKMYARMDLGWFLRDTRYCLLNIFADVVANMSAISGAFLLSERFGGIGGMSSTQIMFMLGYATMVDGIFLLFFSMGNVGHISRRIGRGQVDHMVIQPVPFWLQLATEGFLPVSGSSTLLCGIGITVFSALELGLPFTLKWLAVLVISLLSSVAIIISASYTVGSMAFYAPVAAEEVSSTVINFFGTIKSYPLGSLSNTAIFIFCTMLPVGLAAWFPSNMLLMRTPQGFPEMFTTFAAVLLSLLAATSFRKGMKYYAKSGSTRYLDRGHRC